MTAFSTCFRAAHPLSIDKIELKILGIHHNFSLERTDLFLSDFLLFLHLLSPTAWHDVVSIIIGFTFSLGFISCPDRLKSCINKYFSSRHTLRADFGNATENFCCVVNEQLLQS